MYNGNYKIKDLTGLKFGLLRVINFSYTKGGYSYWFCKCNCGNTRIYKISYLTNKLNKNRCIRSCGCVYEKNKKKCSTKHGLCYSRFYHIWRGIKQRCLDFNSFNHRLYGGRGIKVCDKWLKFENFRDDMYESYQKHCQEFGEKQTSIDRVNNNGNYCKENCRWSTKKEQGCNRRTNRIITFNGESRCLREWENKLGFNRGTLYNRLTIASWSIKKALNTPIVH